MAFVSYQPNWNGSISGAAADLTSGHYSNRKESITHKYEPNFSANDHNIYIEEYFSGPDVRIYLDGGLKTGISQISFSLQEQLKPIYGYASRLFDEVAVGNRIVVGSFTIPIKNTDKNNFASLKSSLNSNYPGSTVNTYNRPTWVDGLINYDKNQSTIRSNQTQNQVEYGKIKEERLSPFSDKSCEKALVETGYLTPTQLGNTSSLMLSRAIKNFQKASGLSATGALDDATRNALEARGGANEDAGISARGGGTNVTTSGNGSSQPSDSFFSPNRSETLRKNGYSILIEIGDNQHLKAIVDVRFRSKSIGVDASGNPVSETFEFIGRDLRENTESTDTL